jgi:hypothetical protein
LVKSANSEEPPHQEQRFLKAEGFDWDSKKKFMPSCFLRQMKGIFDHRITGMATYPLDEILLAMPVGGVCGT